MSIPIAQSAYAVLYRIEIYKQLPNPHPRSQTLKSARIVTPYLQLANSDLAAPSKASGKTCPTSRPSAQLTATWLPDPLLLRRA